jgi:hypothetical protein
MTGGWSLKERKQRKKEDTEFPEMKYFVVISLLCCSLQIKSQTLFFDQLLNSTWTSETQLCDSSGVHKNIGLSKCSSGLTGLKTGTFIWQFNKQLTISSCQAGNEKKLLATYSYKTDREKGNLYIYTNSGTICYKVGIVSTGNYALLSQKKTKNQKTQP